MIRCASPVATLALPVSPMSRPNDREAAKATGRPFLSYRAADIRRRDERAPRCGVTDCAGIRE
jgi:hypothetical protein